MPTDCLFCRIVTGATPATIVRRGERTLAFRDISPVAPTHVLVIPREHHSDIAALTAADPDLLVEVHREAAAVAQAEGVVQTGYRLVANTGRDGHQTVPHVHLHILGGRPMGWPPG
jgi:histidine triad (HIT) family protein